MWLAGYRRTRIRSRYIGGLVSEFSLVRNFEPLRMLSIYHDVNREQIEIAYAIGYGFYLATVELH